MRSALFIFLAMVLAGRPIVSGQDIVPPPGFSPESGVGGGLDPTSAPAESSIFSRDLGDDNFYQRYSGSGPGKYQDQGDEQRAGTASLGDRSRLPPYQTILPPLPTTPVELPFPTFWVSAEALYWWTKGSPVPVPLVTDGGSLGSGSAVLLGDTTMKLPVGTGGRFTVGAGLGSGQDWGMEGTYFFLNNGTVAQSVFSDGSPWSGPLAFPFYNPTLPGEDSTPIALPGAFAGYAEVATHTSLQGVEGNILKNVRSTGPVRFDVLGGLRYLNVQEGLNFMTNSPNVYPNPYAYFNTFDSFNTRNNFYGGQIGSRASYDNGRLFFNATGKLALGATAENVRINGGTATNAGGYASAPGAYLSQPSNIGSQSKNEFAVVPEFDFNFGVYVAPWARVTLGYSFLYISSVARPGDQIDRVINPSQAPAITGNFPGTPAVPARPTNAIHESDLWTQGLNFGLELRF